MHSLEANASMAGLVLVASQYTFGGCISPNIQFRTFDRGYLSINTCSG